MVTGPILDCNTACAAIGDLSWHNASIQESLGSNGVLGHIARAMKAFSNDRSLQLRASQAIANASWNNSSNQERFVASGVCNKVVMALSKYHDDREVQC